MAIPGQLLIETQTMEKNYSNFIIFLPHLKNCIYIHLIYWNKAAGYKWPLKWSFPLLLICARNARWEQHISKRRKKWFFLDLKTSVIWHLKVFSFPLTLLLLLLFVLNVLMGQIKKSSQEAYITSDGSNNILANELEHHFYEYRTNLNTFIN